MTQFLQARRAGLKPEEVGLPRGKRRLTPGLRREEVASLAGVGLTWYTWLEQGRDIQVSSDTLARIAGALRLSASDALYLSTLAEPPARAPAPAVELDPWTSLFVDSVKTSIAMVVNDRLDVITFNPVADSIFAFGECDGPFARNHVWRAFMDPRRRHLYAECHEHVPNLVGVLRTRYAANVGEPAFEELLDELRTNSPWFDRTWRSFLTAPLEYTRTFHLNAPRLGLLRSRPVRFLLPNTPDYALFSLVAADRDTSDILERASRDLPDTSRPAPRT